MQKSQIISMDQLPGTYFENSLLVYDQVLEEHDFFSRWKNQFSHSLGLEGGEEVKNIERFPELARKVLKAYQGLDSDFQILAVGGGSIGDFCGFMASIFKRGVPLIQIPSTWLSSIDSAHGGKNALNILPYKNQIGTFYAATKVYLIKELLLSQPEILAQQALGELWKIALLDSEGFWKKLEQTQESKSSLILWENLTQAVEAKWKIILQDPYERNKTRQVLNLGHTFGHVIEAHHKISHGESVSLGLEFALNWSEKKGHLSADIYNRILKTMIQQGYQSRVLPLPEDQFLNILSQDKKKAKDSKITFIFLENFAKPLRVDLKPEEILRHAQEQGWIQ